MVTAIEQDEWKAESPLVTACGYCDKEEGKGSVVLEFLTSRKVDTLMEAMGSKEWFAYLIGKESKGVYLIKDIVIPEQEVTSASVEVNGGAPTEGLIGTIHSHHSMGSFHSSTDLEFAASNHPVCIVVSDNGWSAKVKQDLPCKKQYLATIPVYVSDPMRKELDQFIEENKPKIKNKVFVAQVHSQPGSNSERPCKVCEKNFPWKDLSWEAEISGWLCTPCRNKKFAPAHEENAWGKNKKESASEEACELCHKPMSPQLLFLDKDTELWVCHECLLAFGDDRFDAAFYGY